MDIVSPGPVSLSTVGPPDLPLTWFSRQGHAAQRGHCLPCCLQPGRLATERPRVPVSGLNGRLPAGVRTQHQAAAASALRGPVRAGVSWLYAPPPAPPSSWVLAAETASQQERLQAIAEKRRWQAEMESKRRQLEDDRRQLQHLKSKALRERWLLGETSSASQGDEDMRRQMREDEQRARLLEGSISRLQKEIEVLENAGPLTTAAGEGAAAPSPAKDEKTEVALDSRQAPVGTPKEKGVSNTPVRTVEGSTMMKAVVHAVDGTAENGIHPLSSSEVDELIHKADEVTLSEAGSAAGAAEARGVPKEAAQSTPSRREITGVQAQPGEATSGPPGIQPGQEPPVTMIFMGYQNVEDEAESQKVLGLQGTITAELVVIEDAAELKEPAPPNGSAAEPPAAAASREENQVGPEAPASDPQDLDTKKQRCKCCSIM
ncbi:paralemmin-1 isoform X1 [Panthera tigris]|uniref:paralemmin-1 isoform X1 n=1 Tax=Panthera tigris TaxID=9694 RepID=UPI001C6F7DD7|nr:paralemmin-1 isoform X1 [Panthera tigris]